MLYIYPVLACQSGQNWSHPQFARQRMCILNSWNRPQREHGALRMGNERRGCSDLPSEFGVRGVTRGSETRRWGVWVGTSGSREPPSPSWAGHRSLPGDMGRPEIMRCDGMTRKADAEAVHCTVHTSSSSRDSLALPSPACWALRIKLLYARVCY
jgi:hypothetical protein